LDNKVFDIIDARCNHENHQRYCIIEFTLPTLISVTALFNVRLRL